jgi:eukaryotic translation initiation factor 2C
MIFIFLLSDVSATSFFKAQPVIDFAVEYLNLHDTSRRLSDQDRIKVWTI